MVASPPDYDYSALGRRAILELLERELAAPSLEIEARIADEPWPTLPVVVEPLPLHDALADLRAAGRIVVHPPEPTRGGRPVTLITAVTDARNTTAVETAAARKRLLTARYLGWAQGTPTREAVIGPAAERVVHASLTKAAPAVGYRLENPRAGTAATFLGMTVPIGPLDNAALLPTVESGLPGPTVAVPIEVKNLRDWLYPNNAEVYQLLTKAAKLQQARPGVPIMPLLIARRIHITTFRMFKDLGAYGIQTKRQYIGAVDGGDERIQEVRTGLGFFDLIHLTEGGDLTAERPTAADDDPTAADDLTEQLTADELIAGRRTPADDLITRRLTRVIPRDAARVSEDWAITASDTQVVGLFAEMRAQSRIVQRSQLLHQLRERIDTMGRYTGGW